MTLTDPVSDMLTRVRNACNAKLKYTSIPASKLKIEITRILESEGFIQGFRLIRDGKQGLIKIAMKYDSSGNSALRGIVRVSKPSCRIYKKASELPRIRSGLGLAILSTSSGVLTSKEAESKKVGGEVLAYLW